MKEYTIETLKNEIMVMEMLFGGYIKPLINENIIKNYHFLQRLYIVDELDKYIDSLSKFHLFIATSNEIYLENVLEDIRLIIVRYIYHFNYLWTFINDDESSNENKEKLVSTNKKIKELLSKYKVFWEFKENIKKYLGKEI